VTPAWTQPPTSIVTGGASGIGVAIAQCPLAYGAAVAIFDLDGAAAVFTKALAPELEFVRDRRQHHPAGFHRHPDAAPHRRTRLPRRRIQAAEATT
jgi:NAD(P)-dependent dehydrogenase (short-subunit alcohol dehydrogenase family)